MKTVYLSPMFSVNRDFRVPYLMYNKWILSEKNIDSIQETCLEKTWFVWVNIQHSIQQAIGFI